MATTESIGKQLPLHKRAVPNAPLINRNCGPLYYLLSPSEVSKQKRYPQGYEGLERKLKEVFMERSGILQQLLKTSKELDGIKGNLQSLKNDEAVAKKDVQRILALSQKQREEMKSLQEALQKQLNEAAEKAEKQQATINFLKAEMERKTKIIKDLQQENKSLKNKLLSGSKLCGIHAEESKKIQAQLKELRYGKKDLIFKGQQLTDLELKLTAAKKELEKAALDKESQLKALKETVHLCLSSVLHNQPPTANRIPSKPSVRLTSLLSNSSGVLFQHPHTKDISLPWKSEASKTETTDGKPVKKGNRGLPECQSPNAGKNCSQNQTEGSLEKKAVKLNPYVQQKTLEPSWEKTDVLKSVEDNKKILENEDNKKGGQRNMIHKIVTIQL